MHAQHHTNSRPRQLTRSGRSPRPTIHPYLVDEVTFTRADILAARQE